MEIYNATVEGNVNKLRNLVNDLKYPLFEEISAKGYFWTSLHYAMHYGKYDVISYILKYAESKNVLNLVIRSKSNDNRCPITCLIRSSSIAPNVKIEIMDKILTEFKHLYVSADVVKEAKSKGVEKALVKHNIIS